MSAAITAALVVAGGTAYAANKQSKAAKAANKAATGPWSETTTREPWAAAMPYLEGALGENQRVYQQALGAYQRASRIGMGSGRGKGGKQVSPDAKRAELQSQGLRGKALQKAMDEWRSAGGGRGGRGGGGGGGQGGSRGGANRVLARLEDRAMNRSPLLDQASGYVSSTLGDAGDGSGPFGGNPVYNELYRRLTAGDPQTPGADDGTGGTGAGGGGGEGIPDSMTGSTFWNDQARQLFDPSRLDPANDPTMAPYIEALRREMGEDLEQQLGQIDDRANSVGMYGGSGRALEAARTREEGQEALGSTLAQTYMGAREANLARQMQALGMISERDLALMDSNESGRLNDLDRLYALGGALTGERQWGTEAAMGLHEQEMGDLGNVFGIYEQRNRAAAAARERELQRQISQQRWRAGQARQDALMPMSMFGDYLKGLGVLTDLGPSTTTSSGQGMRGGGQMVSEGPGAAAAGLSSLGGSMMALYGMGAFDRGRQPIQQQRVEPLPVTRQAPNYFG